MAIRDPRYNLRGESVGAGCQVPEATANTAGVWLVKDYDRITGPWFARVFRDRKVYSPRIDMLLAGPLRLTRSG